MNALKGGPPLSGATSVVTAYKGPTSVRMLAKKSEHIRGRRWGNRSYNRDRCDLERDILVRFS